MRSILVALLFCSAPLTANALDLSLVCTGSGSAPSASTTFGSATDLNGRTVYGNGTTVGRDHIADRVRVEIVGDTGRINIPRVMLPPLHNGADAGWRPLENLQITDDEITARFTINILNKPAVSIDRRSGTIDIHGFARFEFSGDCTRVENEPDAHAF